MTDSNPMTGQGLPFPDSIPDPDCGHCRGAGFVPALIQDYIDGPQRKGFMPCWCVSPTFMRNQIFPPTWNEVLSSRKPKQSRLIDLVSSSPSPCAFCGRLPLTLSGWCCENAKQFAITRFR